MFGEHAGNAPKPGPHPMIGALKGTFTLEPGYDLTRPALEPEELSIGDASLEEEAEWIAAVTAKQAP